MSTSRPRPITDAAIGDAPLTFRWDDWRVDEDFTFDSAPVVARAAALSIRAQVALGIGIYEWTLWRFASFSDDSRPHQVAEAAWCASVDRRYFRNRVFDRRQWLGPVRGPLWCGLTWLVPLAMAGDNDAEEIESGLAYLPRLAMHVLPNPERFLTWLDRCLERLTVLHPAPPEDPFDDLFRAREEQRRGPLVAPEALDPDRHYRPDEAAELLARRLASVNPADNPFLRSPEEMLRLGFPGTPYRL